MRERNLTELPRTARPPAPAGQEGVALVLALLFLVILSALILGFFGSVTNETVSSSNEAARTIAKELSDSAVNVVTGQIVDATRSRNPGESSSSQTWSSQPGLIRTYMDTGENGKVYKLYSSDKMIASGQPFAPDTVPDDWKMGANADIYTDLNAPVSLTNSDPNGPPLWDYPIVDPDAQEPPGFQAGSSSTAGIVEGFTITNPPGFIRPSTQTPATNNGAPMPVKWLYMLKDGTLVAGSGSNGAVMVAGATNANPIKARIAFWTDDESCKVNINTASEGTYWDMPRTVTMEDTGVLIGQTAQTPSLSLCQPTAGEYQRYPGHPATTCLSPILGGFGLPAPNPALPSGQSGDFAKLTPYYDLAPRVNYRDVNQKIVGSQGGTVIPYINTTSGIGKPNAIVPDYDRLYVSVDELMFKSPPQTPPANRVENRPAGSADSIDGISRKVVERIKFFLSAHSNAPEVTLFNTPRVSMWPEWKDPTSRTTFDKTIAFCSGTGPATTGEVQSPYYFTRENNRSMTQDYAGAARNQALYRYLQTSMAKNVPGYGQNFKSKFAGDSDQTLTNIYDYIRCTNLYDTTPGAKKYTKLSTLLTFGPQADGTGDSGGGEVLPIKINGTQGFGRYASVTEVDLLFYATMADKLTGGVPAQTADATQMGCLLLVNFMAPGQGLPGMAPNLRFAISGLNTLTANNQPIFPGTGNSAADYIENAPVRFGEGRGIGGSEDPNMTLSVAHSAIFQGGFKQFKDPNGSIPGNYPFFTPASNWINIAPPPPPAAPNHKFPFSGGDIQITIFAGDTGEQIQKIQMHFPRGNFAKPTVRQGVKFPLFFPTAGVSYTLRDQYHIVYDQDTCVALENAGPGDDPNDTARPNSAAGDMRMVAALANVPATYFHAHQDWEHTDDPAIPAPNRGKAYGISRGTGENGFSSPVVGTLARGMYRGQDGSPSPNYHDRRPDVPSRVVKDKNTINTGVTRVNGDPTTPGDWDTGYGLQKDGAYLNLPDMGDASFQDIDDQNGRYRYPYVDKEDHFLADAGQGLYFSPNRMIPSSMMLGSIPSGVQRNLAWQSLLFNPKPDDRLHPGHGGANSLPDHLVADLFWMPVVEPYAISQPFSTAGKINMNYEIQPFTYMRRATGIYAVMKATKFMAMPASLFNYNARPKLDDTNGVSATQSQIPPAQKFRFAIDIRNTLKQFDLRFSLGKSFKSATEISEINLYPDSQDNNGVVTDSTNGMLTFWNQHTVTGNNLRDKPYVDIYPRLTTKSNTFTVHYHVQALKKARNTPPDQWVSTSDRITAEYRGNSTIERYIDVSDPNLPDFAANPDRNIDQYYKIRVVSTKRFAP